MQICFARLIRLLGHFAPKQLVSQPNPICINDQYSAISLMRPSRLSEIKLHLFQDTCQDAYFHPITALIGTNSRA
jgi:hypothetical protein